jgi:ribonuclease R
VGESFEGRVTGVTNFGLFVQIVENLVEGLVRIEALGDEWFEFNEKRFELRGSRSGKKFRLGDRFEIRVDRVDRTLQRVDFSLAEGGPSPTPRRRERGKKSRGRRR